jgi:CBS domain containing-hemolysin-like protein
VDELTELLHAELPEGDWDTVGGLLFNVLGRVPVEGEAVEVDGVRLVAERVEGHRIGRIRISSLHAPGDAPGEGHSRSAAPQYRE